MRRTTVMAATLTAMMTLCAYSGAWADGRAGTISFSPLIGGCLFEGDQRLKTSAAYGGALGYNGDEHLGLELGFSFIDSGTRHGRDVDVNTYFYHIDGVYHLTRRGIVQPYVAMGIGGMTFNYHTPAGRDDPSTTAFAFNHGGGIEIFILDNLAVRTDLRHIITFNGGFNDLLFTGGVTVFFGGKKAEATAVASPPPPAPAPVPEASATPPPAKPQEVCIDLKVLFDFDKDEVKPQYHDEIKKVADFLKDNPTFHGTIEGGTDAVGSEDYNQDLSMRRAESVKKYLVDNFNIDASRLRTVGYGKLRPIATNLTEEGRQQNRRAVRVYCSTGDDMPLAPTPKKCIVLKVDFAVNSAEVDSERYADALKEMADYMKAHPDLVGTIEGYADATGSGQYNMELAQKRADNVKKALVDKFGVPADKLRAEAYGKERPIDTNETPEGRAKNRYAVQMICEP